MKPVLGIALALCAWTLPVSADVAQCPFTYHVLSVSDGDTLTATDGNLVFRVRIASMDAPEKGQPYAKVATQRLKNLLAAHDIRIQPVGRGTDRYGRVLGQVFVDNHDIALTMIQDGLTTYYRPTCREYPLDAKQYNYHPEPYVRAEQSARTLRKHVWSSAAPILPCQYRLRSR